MLCLHGFYDNCASFDQLIPLLDDHNIYLCFDFPNHGRSSKTPPGVRWTMENYVMTVKRVTDHYYLRRKVAPSFVCVGHSMGGQIGILFSAVYPEHVKKLVILDTAGPVEMYPDELVFCKRQALDKLLKLENYIWPSDTTVITSSPREYTRLEALNHIKRRMYITTAVGLSDVGAESMVDRHLRPGPTAGKYLLTNDPRVRVTYSDWFSVEQHQNVVANVACPTLLIRATESTSYYNELYKVFIDMYGRTPNFRSVWVEGNHDVHMNHPHRVAQLINKFINNTLSKL